MAKNNFYKLIASPRKRRNIFQKITRNKHKRQLILSVSAVYVLMATVVGIGLFNSNDNDSQASQPAFIASNIRLSEDNKLETGSEVELSISIQNTSINESINDISVNLLSTENVIEWSQITSKTKLSDGQVFDVQDNKSKIPFLGAAEKAEYKAYGVVNNHNFDAISVLAKFSYTNQLGTEITESNRLFVSNGVQSIDSQNLYSISTDKTIYGIGDQILFELTNPNNTVIDGEFKTGKIYISNKDTKNVVDSLNCTFDENAKCQAILTDLDPGSYSAIFLDESENPSFITEFQIFGANQSTFTPSPESNLNLPFANGSINGEVPVYANNLIGLNSSPTSSDFCTFVVSKDGQTLLESQAKVNSNRECRTNIQASQLPGDGVYDINLKDTALTEKVSIVAKPTTLLPLENTTLSLQANKAVNLKISAVNNNGTLATFGILHTNSGEYQQVSTGNNGSFTSENSVINAEIPGDYFQKGGLYKVFAKLDDELQTEFINLDFNDNQAGLSGSGVIVDNLDNLQVDRNLTFSVQNVKDRNDNIINLGDCTGEIQTTDINNPVISINGEINNGNCEISSPAGTITKAGPITVSFQGDSIANDINQTRDFVIKPGLPTTLGDINLEFSPARVNHANNLIIGPVTDGYGNLTDSFNNSVQIVKDDVLIYDTKVDVIDGFALTTIPASVFQEGEMVITTTDESGALTQSKTVSANNPISKLNLPVIPTELNSDDNLEVKFNTEADEEALECKVNFIRSQNEFTEDIINPDDSYICDFDLDINEFRNNESALVKLTAGNKEFAQIVTLTESEANQSFTLNPQIRINKQDNAEIKLISSPITDRQGQVIDEGKMRIEFNGKVEEVEINKGIATLSLPASKLDNNDIRKNLGNSLLELNLSAKASVTSINSNNNLSIFLGQINISNTTNEVDLVSGTNVISDGDSQIFTFQTENCNVLQQSKLQGSFIAQSHFQAGLCYVEVNGNSDQYTLSFEDQGFTTGQYEYTSINKDIPTVKWCQESSCQIEILGSVTDSEAILFDGENQYKFSSNELGNIIQIEQNGLNPLKSYPIELTYTLESGEQVKTVNTVSGEYLQVK